MRKSLSKRNLWEALPAPAKALAGMVLGRLPLDRLLGRSFRETRAFLKKSERWTREQIEVYQIERLGEVLALAEAKSPYYRNVFRSATFRAASFKKLSDLSVLPTMSKADVVSNLAAMMTCPPNSPRIDYVSTGGSSGAPFAFYAPATRSAIEYAYLTAGWERSGYCMGDMMVVVRGRVVEKTVAGIKREHDPLLRQHFYSNFHLTESNSIDYLKHMAGLGPCVLHAYPSSASVLARVVLRHPELKPANLKAVLLESEGVFEDQAEAIRQAFGIEPYSSYGHSEKLVLATGCESSAAYHVWPTYGYLELLDGDGNRVSEIGQRGELVGTGFINTVVPMIRYRTGDFAEYLGDHCPECGRNHLLLGEIAGRGRQASLKAIDGAEISMTAFNMHDDCLRQVHEYQFIQDIPGEAIMLVSTREGWSNSERDRVEAMVNRRLQGQVEVTVRAVEQMHRTPVGKLLRVMTSQQLAIYTK